VQRREDDIERLEDAVSQASIRHDVRLDAVKNRDLRIPLCIVSISARWRDRSLRDSVRDAPARSRWSVMAMLVAHAQHATPSPRWVAPSVDRVRVQIAADVFSETSAGRVPADAASSSPVACRISGGMNQARRACSALPRWRRAADASPCPHCIDVHESRSSEQDRPAVRRGHATSASVR
jgi:hypothetical protein